MTGKVVIEAYHHINTQSVHIEKQVESYVRFEGRKWSIEQPKEQIMTSLLSTSLHLYVHHQQTVRAGCAASIRSSTTKMTGTEVDESLHEVVWYDGFT